MPHRFEHSSHDGLTVRSFLWIHIVESGTIVSPRQAILVGLLALVPVASYVLVLTDPIGIIAGINVVIVTVALYIAFQTIERERDESGGQSAI